MQCNITELILTRTMFFFTPKPNQPATVGCVTKASRTPSHEIVLQATVMLA